MKISPIEALADCIMRFEGWIAPYHTTYTSGSTSWRNRNPGNLRASSPDQKVDEKGYRIFNTLSDGWDALCMDLEEKLHGHSSHNLTPQNTLHDLFNIYAPYLDHNNPQHYSQQIAVWLCKIYGSGKVTPDTKLEDILKLGS